MANIKHRFSDYLKNKFVDNKGYLYIISFFLPIFVMACIYIAKGVYPFGDRMYLARDMYHQYAPFFSEFYNKLKSGSSLTYSWNIGLGTNFTGLYAYYLASPINWLIALINRDYLIEIMNVFIILKIAASSVTCTYYLRHHYKRADLGLVAISLFYALSAYVTAYSWNIMWLDCIMLLPLIVLGLERLVNERKYYLYCITLGISIISNYYISYMICIFLILYFFVLLFTSEKEKNWQYFKSRIIDFAVFSLLAGMFAAVLIIPEYFALNASASGAISFPDTISRYFSIYEITSRGLISQEISTTTAYDPNIYSSIIVYLFLPLYLILPSKKSKEKVGKVLLAVFFLISFNFNILNYIWHGFHFPNSLPARQSFIFIFLLLTMSYEVLINLESFKNKHIYGAFGLAIALFLSYEHLLVDLVFEYYIVYISIFFLSLYLIIIQIYRNLVKNEGDYIDAKEDYKEIESTYLANGENYLESEESYDLLSENNNDDDEYENFNFKKTLVMIVFLLIATAESLVNFGTTGLSVTSRPYYIDDNEAISSLLTKVKEEDETFYRTEKYKRRTKNDGAWHGYKGFSIFSSTSGEKLNDYLASLGFENSMNAFSFYGQTPLTSSLFSVKYMLAKEGEIPSQDSDLTSLLYEDDGQYIYKNNYTLPLGFMMPDYFDMKWDRKSNNPFIVQNNLSNNVISDNLFDEINTINNGSIATLSVVDNREVYIYIPSSDVETLEFSITDINGVEKATETYNEYNKEHIINLGSFEQGDYIHISSPENMLDLNVYAYTFDEEVFINLYNKLIKHPFNIEIFEDTYIKGNISLDEDGIMYTSIPYDEGWSVKVDGFKVDSMAFADALLAVPLSQGDHTIELSYSPRGLKLGLIISTISIIMFVAIVLLETKPYKASR